MTGVRPGRPEIYKVNIVCPGCGSVGVMTWEKSGQERFLISVSSGFYERVSETPPYPIEVVCIECGKAQPED